jgi:methylated-DNA-protein-cysteine methyltransferase-like protein
MFPKILAQVRRIPKGRVSTYGAVAAAAGHPGAARQVVWALRAGEGVPWHRVVGAGGKIRLTGENGFEQRLRLRSEGVVIAGDKIDLKRFGHAF